MGFDWRFFAIGIGWESGIHNSLSVFSMSAARACPKICRDRVMIGETAAWEANTLRLRPALCKPGRAGEVSLDYAAFFSGTKRGSKCSGSR